MNDVRKKELSDDKMRKEEIALKERLARKRGSRVSSGDTRYRGLSQILSRSIPASWPSCEKNGSAQRCPEAASDFRYENDGSRSRPRKKEPVIDPERDE